ncbi:hypothetical protein E2562_031750 [Oryza meyeriana var. granulata]|uniref:Uncharacterized protein n=1 Tax=Oryza meyeriana var. granulata TaxID=110450 RepID=A0A6G1CVF8_9ORYZ|nr:hypothetical protein E2562_031750 [Oryza meyeriana var. granulata]
MAHDVEASGSSQLQDDRASRGLGPGTEEIGPKTRPVLREGCAPSPPAKKKKTTPMHERRPFASSPWGLTGPRPR